MESKDFEERTTLIAKDQPQYKTLPAHVTNDGRVITLWQLSPEEIKKVNETGEIWLQILTGNNPLQPICMTVEKKDLAFDKSEYDIPPNYKNWREVLKTAKQMLGYYEGCAITFTHEQSGYKESIPDYYIKKKALSEMN